MVEIISAKAAFNEAKYRKAADEILVKVEEEILKTCNAGRFNTEVNVDSRIEKGSIDLVLNDLIALGYKAEFKIDTAAACEHYWDKLIISWNFN